MPVSNCHWQRVIASHFDSVLDWLIAYLIDCVDAELVCWYLQRFQDVEQTHLQQMRLFVDTYMTTWNTCYAALSEVCQHF